MTVESGRGGLAQLENGQLENGQLENGQLQIAQLEVAPSVLSDGLLISDKFLGPMPWGAVRINDRGGVLFINRAAAELLEPLTGGDSCTDLAETLRPVTSTLERILAAKPNGAGVALSEHLVELAPGRDGMEPAVVSMSVMDAGAGQWLVLLVNQSVANALSCRLKRLEAEYDTLASRHVVGYAAAFLDADGIMLDRPYALAQLIGRDVSEIAGQPFTVVFDPTDVMPETIHDRLREASRAGWSPEMGWRLRSDGTRFWGNSLIVPVPGAAASDRQLPAYVLVLRDGGNRADQPSTQLHRRALVDALTGLATRAAFMDAALLEETRWLSLPRPVSLITLDIDRFKSVNDTYGHATGDVVLTSVARVVLDTVRRVDVAGRLGGEEFAILLPSTPLSVATTVAERLRTAVEAMRLKAGEAAIQVTASFGVTERSHHSSMSAAMEAADAALYAAKRGGRNRVELALPSGTPAVLNGKAESRE